MRYTESHEWIQLKGNVGRVGITRYAQKELGEIVHVELPRIGRVVEAKQEICVLESTKAAADVYAPVSGKVVAINEGLKQSPSSLNESPEAEGWLFQIELSNPRELDPLMSQKEYQDLCQT